MRVAHSIICMSPVSYRHIALDLENLPGPAEDHTLYRQNDP